MDRVKRLVDEYPRQFWILLGGMLIISSGNGMVWPFLTLLLRQRLDVSLTTVGFLLSLQSGARLITTLLAGPVVDRLGRKWVMVASLAASSLGYIALGLASNLQAWAAALIAIGAASPLFHVGAEAMVADLIPPERRIEAFSLARMGNNVGVALGPAVGGFIATMSYAWAFFAAAMANALFAVMALAGLGETLPRSEARARQSHPTGGYGPLLRDRPFLAFWATYALATVPSWLVFVYLSVYAKEQFGVPESSYGFIMTTNAMMVVLLQYGVSRITKRYPDLPMLAMGALFYALGAGSVALGHSFSAFLASMVLLTVGEMTIVPTGTTLTANLAPAEMRGRYMGFLGLTWGLAGIIGPIFGGYLNDHVAPIAIWYGGLGLGLAATLGFLLLCGWLGKSLRRQV